MAIETKFHKKNHKLQQHTQSKQCEISDKTNKQTTTITTRKHNIKLMLNNNKEKKLKQQQQQMQHNKITVINLDWLRGYAMLLRTMLCFSCLTLWLIDWFIECNDFNLTYANVCDSYRLIMNWILKDIDIQMWIYKRII